MERRPLKRLGAMVAAGAFAIALISCKGDAGPNGTNGTNGINGTPGTNGTNGLPGASVAPVNAGQLSKDVWSALTLKGSITAIDMKAGTPKVTFTVTDQSGNGIAGLGGPGPDGLSKHMAFTIAKLIPAGGTTANPVPGAPSRWVNYTFVVPPAKAGDPASLTAFPDPETSGTLVDNLDGSYVYTFKLDITQAATMATALNNPNIADLDDLSYDANATHRLVVLVGGAPGGTPVKNGLNLIKDFVPANGAAPLPANTDERQIVQIGACNACHTKLTLHADFFPAAVDTQACVVCHTDQMKFGYADSRSGSSLTLVPVNVYGQAATLRQDGVAVPLFPNFIHKIHMGDQLASTGNALFGTPFDTRYPQDIRNCTTCHTAQPAPTVTDAAPVAAITTDGDNWMKQPSRMACGSCHDNVIFADGTNHGAAAGQAQPDDSKCAGCHTPANNALSHLPVMTAAQNGTNVLPPHGGMLANSSYAENPANQPANSHRIRWQVQAVTVTNNVPSMTFNILDNDVPLALNVTDNTKPLIPSPFISNQSSAANFNGPQVFLGLGIPQDGITPADYNFHTGWTLQQVFDGTAKLNGVAVGTITQGTGNYVVTLSGYTIPANTSIVVMGIGLGVLTETDLPAQQSDMAPLGMTTFQYVPVDYTYNGTTSGGLMLPTKIAWANASAPFITRRQIIKPGSCNACHGNLTNFTTSTAVGNTFHAAGIGDGNDETSCALCHNPNSGVDSMAWSYNAKTWVHAIHAADFRNNAYTAHSKSGSSFWTIGYPGLLNNCEACHVPGSYNFANADSQAQLPNLLWETVAQNAYPLSATVLAAPPVGTSPAVIAGKGYVSPWINPTVTYGKTWSFVAPTTVGGSWTINPPTTATNGTTQVASLVTSPITGACAACHDSASAVAHFTTNGGYFYAQRTQVQNPTVAGVPAPLPNTTNTLVSNEQCLVCHGTGTILDIQTVHMNF